MRRGSVCVVAEVAAQWSLVGHCWPAAQDATSWNMAFSRLEVLRCYGGVKHRDFWLLPVGAAVRVVCCNLGACLVVGG